MCPEYRVTYVSGRTSISYRRRHFRRIFTLPFLDPISCGFFVGDQKHPDARTPQSRLLSFPRNLFALNMIHLGESLRSVSHLTTMHANLREASASPHRRVGP